MSPDRPSDSPSPARPLAPWREKLHEVIFEADTAAGKAFDVGLLIAIGTSILAVSLETVDEVAKDYGGALDATEWVLTGLFTIEYVLRLLCVRRPLRYARSFYGVVDLVSILPTWLSGIFPGVRSLAVIRSFRLLRMFRVFKLGRMLHDATVLRRAVWEARGKIVVFLATVMTVVVISGSAMYFVENIRFADVAASDSAPADDARTSQFTSIPQAMYWAIVTMTTVGYGDVVPQTALGKLLSALLILVGYSLIIVPTGFVSAELVRSKGVSTQACPSCMAEGHDADARHCKRCGARL